MAKGFVPSDEDVERQSYAEYLDEVRDIVGALQVTLGNLSSNAVPAAEALGSLRRAVHNLKLATMAVHAPLMRVVVHRLDEYLAEMREPTPERVADVESFLDKIMALADGEVPDLAETVVRQLPAKRHADIDFGDIEQKNVEVLVVLPEKALSRIVERELAACGYRVSNARDPFHALETAVRTKPDLVIAAMELDGMSGVDLACALAAIGATQSIPFAVLTSYAWGHPKLKGLPPRVGVIRKGAKFGDDLAETLGRFGIT